MSGIFYSILIRWIFLGNNRKSRNFSYLTDGTATPETIIKALKVVADACESYGFKYVTRIFQAAVRGDTIDERNRLE
jgi:hypothetical protein